MTKTHIPDSNALFEMGRTGEKPFLGSPSVVDGILMGVIQQVQALRGRQLNGEEVDISSECDKIAQQTQNIFYGRDDRHEIGTWNKPSLLGTALVLYAGLGGHRADAVYRAIIAMINVYVDAYLKFEADEISDGDFQLEISAILHRYTQALVGIKR